MDMIKITVSYLEKDVHTWWYQLTVKSMDYKLGYVGWYEFKSDIEIAFLDEGRKLKLHWQLSGLRQTSSIAAYTKEFRKIVLELWD